MPKIDFAVETAAQPTLVISTMLTTGGQNQILPLTPDGDDKFKGSITMPPSRFLLTWIFVGSPGASYEIGITPTAKITLSRGVNPIKSRISTQETAGTGGVFVTVSA